MAIEGDITSPEDEPGGGGGGGVPGGGVGPGGGVEPGGGVDGGKNGLPQLGGAGGKGETLGGVIGDATDPQHTAPGAATPPQYEGGAVETIIPGVGAHDPVDDHA